jgi:oligoribonuclease NrnB/cAMP/cGMP phosphodiesterase (DHH superfamily)
MRYVLYHSNCYDGFGAAWAAWLKFEDQAQYLPVSYGHEPPEMEPGSDVLIVDFSYPRDTLKRIASEHSLQVLDHHQTAEAALRGLPYCEFDMNRSGAMMTWQHLHPEKEPPAFVQYIQDRDLWRFALPHSREVSAWLASHPFDFQGWTDLAAELAVVPDRIFREGEALLRLKNQYVESMCRHPHWVELGGHRIPAANATVCFSEVGERLCELFPEAAFAAYWTDRNDGLRQWGLRSRNGFDVSEVAKQYGGGGHKAAAGFTTPLEPVRADRGEDR